MKRSIVLAVCAAALVAACQPHKPAKPAAAAVQARYDTDLPMAEFMDHVVDPGAFMYWKAGGTAVDAKGEHDLSPTTEEGWENLVSGATIVMEAGNALQLPGRTRAPEADWLKYAQVLTAQAKVARAAAEKHDKQGIFEEGAKLYQVCVDCHEEYVIQPQIRAEGPAKGDPLPDFPADVKARMQAYGKTHPAGA